MKLQLAPGGQGGRGAPRGAGARLALQCGPRSRATAITVPAALSTLGSRGLCVAGPWAQEGPGLAVITGFVFFPQRALKQAFPSQGAQMPILGTPGPHPLLQTQRASLEAVKIVPGDASSGGLRQRVRCSDKRLTPKEIAQRIHRHTHTHTQVYMCEGLDLD